MASTLDTKFEKIIKQELAFSSGSLGMNMLLTKLAGKYKANPTPEALRGCLAEVNAFVEKYRSTLDADLKKLELN